MLCSSPGYCYNFDIYYGAKPTNLQSKPLGKSVFPLGSKLVLELLECVERPSDHTVFFDNYFTTYNLLKILNEKGFRVTGTIREIRTKH